MNAIMAERPEATAVQGWAAVRWQRVEATAVLVVALGAYAALDASWVVFALLLLAPDLGMLGYLGGARAGALTYNAMHVYVGPAALFGAWLAQLDWALPLALIWLAHIALDRALGYGLKRPTDFRDTHLGRIGGPGR